ncbi:MAG: ATP-binding protein [Fibromonadales bacterium]|nr:ATP-binding protein [Fibromonadales bacterium]
MFRKYVVFSVILFLTILIVGSIAFLFSMQQIIRHNKSWQLTKLLEIERTKLEISVNKEIAIVLKMASSPQIKSYFENPTDPDLKKMAESEINAYNRALNDAVFWINDIDKIFYTKSAEPYLIDETDSVNYWYNLTLNKTEIYNFNINYNPDLNVTKLWINAPVFNASHKAIGMLGTGIDLTEFIEAVYKNYHGQAILYFFNSNGEITGASDVKLVAAKKNIQDKLEETYFGNTDVLLKVRNLKSGEAQSFAAENAQAAVISIPTLKWYAIAILPSSINDFKTTLTAFFILGIMVIAFILILSNVFIHRLFTQLQKTMASLEAASKAKSEFLAKMSHEIRTPMNSIIGFTDLALYNKSISPTIRDYFEKIKTSSKGLLGIINDLLDISIIDSGKVVLEKIPFDLNEICDTCQKAVALSAKDKGIKLLCSVGQTYGKKLIGDPVRLRQSILNLLSNSIKFTTHGTVRLTAAVKSISNGKAVISFEVEDSGIGMSEEQLANIFEPFMQADNSASRVHGGTGLGLPITKGFIELMGGELKIESILGVGSKSSFDLTFRTCE